MWCIAIFAGTLITLGFTALHEALGIALWHNRPDGGVGAFSTHLVLVAPLLVAIAWNRPWGFQRGAAALAVALVVLIAAAWMTLPA